MTYYELVWVQDPSCKERILAIEVGMQRICTFKPGTPYDMELLEELVNDANENVARNKRPEDED